MSETITTVLNQGQQEAAESFFEFLLSDNEKEMKLEGPPGTGKSFLLGQMADKILPQYRQICELMGQEPLYHTVEMMATTNKAANELALSLNRNVSTAHSFLALRVSNDRDTGKTYLETTNRWQVHENKIIIVDEAFTADSDLLGYLDRATLNCKIVYVGDPDQLGPVMETLSPVLRKKIRSCQLTEPVRNADQPALQEACARLRHTVRTGEFLPIQIVPGVIDHVDDAGMQDEIAKHFRQQTRQHRILAYSNNRVLQYADHIRELRGLPETFTEGELLINNTMTRISKKATLAVEEEVELLKIGQQSEFLLIDEFDPSGPVQLEVRYATIKTQFNGEFSNVPLPVDREHYLALVKYFARIKKWKQHFWLKENIPDLRPRDAATIHKEQGSTRDTVFIDLEDLSRCTQPDTVARLLYVAISRAKRRVVLYGNLAKKYGGLAF